MKSFVFVLHLVLVMSFLMMSLTRMVWLPWNVFGGLTFLPLLSFLFSVWVFLLCPKSVPDAAALLVMFWKDFSQNLYEHPVLFTLASSSLKKNKKKSPAGETPGFCNILESLAYREFNSSIAGFGFFLMRKRDPVPFWRDFGQMILPDPSQPTLG